MSGAALSDEGAATATKKPTEGSALAFRQEFMLQGCSRRVQLSAPRPQLASWHCLGTKPAICIMTPLTSWAIHPKAWEEQTS